MTQLATTAARPACIEDPTNLLVVHRLADRLLPPALRAGIHPNSVSVTGMVCGAVAGTCYWHWQDGPAWVLGGFAAMLAWHVMDGLDGKLARASGKSSPLGRLIDGLCDYLVFVMVVLPLALSLPDWQHALALATVSGAAHAVQSAWYEGEREAWKRRARGEYTPALRAPASFWGERLYNAVEDRLGRGARAVDAALVRHPDRQETYLQATAPLLKRLSILSANNRTIVIALACLAGDPRLYWYWEIVGLSLIALLMAALLRRREAEVAGARTQGLPA